MLEHAGKNNKKIWDAIKNITNSTNVKKYALELIDTPCPTQSIEDVNDFFVTVGKKLASKTNSCQNPRHPVASTPQSIGSLNSFVLLDTDESEVERLILDLKNVCSTGWDSISNHLLKENRNVLIPALTHIFNMCLDEGTFPTVLKKSVVHPIHKSGDRGHVTNNRPISILPAVSKLLERIINSRLVKYLEINNLLSNNQFVFRTGKSTCDAVHELVDYVVRNIDSGKKTVGVFLDLAKAFDTVSVPLLLSKLERLGVRGKQLKLFEDYLSGRCQCVKIDKLVSSDLPVTFGVPQGSILGPSLFLVYLNELCGLTSIGGKVISYADDTVLLFSADTWERVYEDAQSGFDTVCHWLRSNMLTLNADKTQYITFSMRNSNSPPTLLSLIAHNCCNSRICECPTLVKTKLIKYLGIIIDNNLSFKPHIELVTARLRKLIYVFKNLRHVADPNLMKQVYLALGQSVLSYCISVWGGAPKTILKPLEVAQRAILKVSTSVHICFQLISCTKPVKSSLSANCSYCTLS